MTQQTVTSAIPQGTTFSTFSTSIHAGSQVGLASNVTNIQGNTTTNELAITLTFPSAETVTSISMVNVDGVTLATVTPVSPMVFAAGDQLQVLFTY